MKVVKVNIEENPFVTSRYNIQTVPSSIFIKDGNVLKKMTGVQSEKTLEEALDKFIDK